MTQDWQLLELEEKIGQFAKMVLMVYENPDNSELWDKLKGLDTENKSYIASSYEPAQTFAAVDELPEVKNINRHLNY